MTHPALHVVDSVAHFILGVVVQDRVVVRPVEGSLYLRTDRRYSHARGTSTDISTPFFMHNRPLNCDLNTDLVAKHESRDSGHQLSEENERQEHGVLQRGREE